MEKQIYYVNLNPVSMEDISPVKIDDSTLIQYEIEASQEEVEQLKHLLNEVQDHDIERNNLFTFRHFDESITEDDRYEFQAGMDHVFETIYKLGTSETKRQIEEMGVLERKPTRNMRYE